MEGIAHGFHEFLDAIHGINDKYRTPRIHMTRMVAVCMLLLRLYLVGTILILAYRFITIVAR